MRDKIFGNTREGTAGHLYALFHSYHTWPRSAILIIAIFYIVVFAVFALSYVYIFTGTASGYRITSDSQINIGTSPVSLSGDSPAAIGPLETSDIQVTTAAANVVNPAAHTSVHIDGKNIPTSSDGSIHKVVSSDGSNASVDVTVDSNGSTGSRTSSSVDVTVQTSSHTSDGVSR
jgi:hypothetical protein